LIFIMFGVKSKSKYSNDLPKWTASNEAEK